MAGSPRRLVLKPLTMKTRCVTVVDLWQKLPMNCPVVCQEGPYRVLCGGPSGGRFSFLYSCSEIALTSVPVSSLKLSLHPLISIVVNLPCQVLHWEMLCLAPVRCLAYLPA